MGRISYPFQKAYDLLMSRQFHPWEGGKGKVTGAYEKALIGISKKEIENKNFSKALDFLVL